MAFTPGWRRRGVRKADEYDLHVGGKLEKDSIFFSLEAPLFWFRCNMIAEGTPEARSTPSRYE